MKKTFVLSLLALLLLVGSAFAQKAFPARPIKIVVPYSAGGTADLTARQIAKHLGRHLKANIYVVNQPGASGSIGAKAVLSEKSDGYTLLLGADSLGTQRVMGISQVSYGDFRALSPLVNDPKVIVVAKDSRFQNIEELLFAMKDGRKPVTMSYTGPGGSGHVQSLLFQQLGYPMSLVAYPGGADCLLAVLSGQVDFTNANLSSVKAYLETGDIRILAAAANQRLAGLPDISCLWEHMAGAKAQWDMPYTPLSLLVKKDVDESVLYALKDALKKALKEPDWIRYCKENDLDRLYEIYETEEDMQAFYTAWESKVSWLLYDAGAAPFSPADFSIQRPAP